MEEHHPYQLIFIPFSYTFYFYANIYVYVDASLQLEKVGNIANFVKGKISGLLVEVDPLVTEFMNSWFKKLPGGRDADDIIDDVVKIVETLDGPSKSLGEWYVRIMENALDRGVAYIAQTQNKINRSIKLGDPIESDGLDVSGPVR